MPSRVNIIDIVLAALILEYILLAIWALPHHLQTANPLDWPASAWDIDPDSDSDSGPGSDYRSGSDSSHSGSDGGSDSDSEDSAWDSDPDLFADSDSGYISESDWSCPSDSDSSSLSDSDPGDFSDHDSGYCDNNHNGHHHPNPSPSYNATFDALYASAALEYGTDPLFVQAQRLSDPNFGPIPGQDPLFSSYTGLLPPWPGNITHPILPALPGPPHPDDRTWQNLLSAEWLIFSFYQTALTTFPPSSFSSYPPTTFSRLLEIRNNEAGHLRLFQSQISPYSLKPGPCRYRFPFTTPASFLALLTVLEISSMAFLTGLVQQPTDPAARGAMLAIAETETRHEVWALMDVWGANPFAGPSDTVFPYADEMLGSTGAFIVPGSCPGLNPEYPTPKRRLPGLSAGEGTVSLAPGSRICLEFEVEGGEQVFEKGKGYFAVFFHGMGNVSVPIETAGWPGEKIWVTIPAQFETKGVVVAVVADEKGAPTKESLVAGPAVILEQPEEVGVALLGGKAGAGGTEQEPVS